MLKSIIVATAVMQVAGSKIAGEDFKTTAITASMVDEINAMKTTWKAEKSIRFANATIADAKMLLGTVLPGEPGFYEPELEKTSFTVTTSDIPTSFDVRTAWPQCEPITGLVHDQSNCGSCWAFGSAEAFNDRYCIATGDNKRVFSAEDTLACCSGPMCGFSLGCNGGQPAGAWRWFTKEGVSSGGGWADVNTGNTCKPYSMQSCAHHVDPPAGMVPCDDVPSYKTPKCTSTCSDAGYGTPYKSDKIKAKTHYKVKGVENMQKELMEKGTLSVSFTVYEDFYAYSSGVYKHVSGKKLGGHAIKMIGWGEENGIPFWICTNSWNKSWGDQGTFKILRGSNECGIENGVVAGTF
jgi:cathepsin B